MGDSHASRIAEQLRMAEEADGDQEDDAPVCRICQTPIESTAEQDEYQGMPIHGECRGELRVPDGGQAGRPPHRCDICDTDFATADEVFAHDCEPGGEDVATDGGTGRLPQAPNVLLSIDPEWAGAILDGEKLWEYRKVAPARGPPLRIVLYATAPVKAAVGVAWSYTVVDRPVPVLVEETVRFTPHSRDDVLEYFGDAETGHGIRIGSYRRFDEPVSRDELESAGLEPAQNFRYIGSVTADEQRVDPALISPTDRGNSRHDSPETGRQDRGMTTLDGVLLLIFALGVLGLAGLIANGGFI